MLRAVRAGALLYSLSHFVLTGLRQPLANFYGDFLGSFPAWELSGLLERRDLYAGNLSQYWAEFGHLRPVWLYGPGQHLITLPLFAFETLKQAYIAWLFVCFVFVGITAAIAARILGDWFVVVLVFCNFNPLYEALTQRTIELFELVLLFAAYAFYRRRRDAACGVAIGVAAMAKFLPLIYVPWLVLKRRWHAFAAALAVIVAIAVVTQPVLGWQHNGTLSEVVQGGFVDSELNQSLSGVVMRLVAWSGSQVSIAMLSRVAIAVCLAAFSALMLRMRRREDTADIEYGLLAAAMVLLPPHNENYYFVFLLLPYVLLYSRYRTRWSWRAALLALSFVLVAVPFPLSIVQRLTAVNVFSLYLRAAIPFLGAALLALVLVAELGSSRAVSDAAPLVPSSL
jgi:Glycosyltransferase family 87